MFLFMGLCLTHFRANATGHTNTVTNAKNKYQKQLCALINHDSSLREQKIRFCILHGDSYAFSTSSICFCPFRSPSLCLSSYLCPQSLRSVSCLSRKHLLLLICTSLPPSCPQVHKLRDFLVTDLLSWTSVPTVCSTVKLQL